MTRRVEYDVKCVVGHKKYWERYAYLDDPWNSLWEERWCFKCDQWRPVKYDYGERCCAVCFLLDELRRHYEDEWMNQFDLYEIEWELAFPPTQKLYPVICSGCGRSEGSSMPHGLYLCHKCWDLTQETEESLQQELYSGG